VFMRLQYMFKKLFTTELLRKIPEVNKFFGEDFEVNGEFSSREIHQVISALL